MLVLAAAGALLLGGSAVHASDTDDRIEASAKKSFKSTAKPDKTPVKKIDDASITAQVKTSLLSHRSTSALKTKVQTTDGVVTLTGVTKSAAEKILVTKLATDISGVSRVINSMTIQAAVLKSHSPPLPPQNLRIVSQ
jgi:osmotically-inducible protein OsmY